MNTEVRVGMKEDNLILKKGFDFAVRIVNAYRYLQNDKKEYVLSKQLLRSGTSIGANIHEAQAGQSKKDFIAKMSIAGKEARETKYWIELLIKTDYFSSENASSTSLLSDIDEIIRLLTRIIKTAQENS